MGISSSDAKPFVCEYKNLGIDGTEYPKRRYNRDGVRLCSPSRTCEGLTEGTVSQNFEVRID
jgi:hypothetical protein